MTVHISMQSIITAGACVAAIIAIVGYMFKAHDWYTKQNSQDIEIKAIKEEQQLLTYGILACLKGLKEQGCDGPVTEAINKIDKHLNQRAHE